MSIAKNYKLIMHHKKRIQLINEIWSRLKEFPLQEQRSTLLLMLKGVTTLWDKEGEEWLRDQIKKIKWNEGPYYRDTEEKNQ
jgi:hypothetical protein